ITYFVPFLIMFAAMIKLQREPAGPDVMRVPGGRPVAIGLAILGMATTAVSIVLASVPPDEEPNKMLAVVKVIGSSFALMAIGAIVYWLGRRRAARMAVLLVVSSAISVHDAFAAAPPTMLVD